MLNHLSSREFRHSTGAIHSYGFHCLNFVLVPPVAVNREHCKVASLKAVYEVEVHGTLVKIEPVRCMSVAKTCGECIDK